MPASVVSTFRCALVRVMRPVSPPAMQRQRALQSLRTSAVVPSAFTISRHLSFRRQLSCIPTNNNNIINMADPTAAFVAHDAISAQEAAQKLAAPARDAFEKDGDLEKVEQELNRLWSAVLDAAEQTSHGQQDKLVDIVRVIQQMPQPVYQGKKFEIWGEEQKWDLLPLFGAQARERLDTAQEKPGAALVNVHAFFARLTAAGINDLSLFAIWVLREALEDPEKDQIANATSAQLLESASVWLIYAAEALAQKSKDTKQFDGKMAKPGSSLSTFKDTPGWLGFCQERWESWIQRLAPLTEAEVATEAKSLISQALDKARSI